MRQYGMKTLADIKQRVARLIASQHAVLVASGLKERVIAAHHKLLLQSLRDALNTDAPLDRLKTLLSDNWALAHNNILSYTAHPTHLVTELLCDIATWVAEEENKKPGAQPILPIQILMPTLCLDSMLPAKIPSLTSPDLDLKKIVQTHIVGREGKYLIPITVLTLCEHDTHLSKVLNYYYDALEDEKTGDPVHPVEMMHLNPDELRRLEDHSADARAWFDIKRQYEHAAKDPGHLLSHLNELTRLMSYNSAHGGIGSQEIAGDGGMTAISDFFVYYDQQLTEEQRQSVPESIQKELVLLKKVGAPEEEIEKDEHGNNLYEEKKYTVTQDGKPVTETRMIPKMATKIQRDAAGNPLYFEEEGFVFQNGKKVIGDDGKPLTQKIKVTKAVANNTDIVSCLGTRKDDLKKEIKGHEDTLARIGVSTEEKSRHIKELIEQHRKARETLTSGLAEIYTSVAASDRTPYTGQDTLGIARQLLEKFNLALEFSDYEAVSTFIHQLTCQELIDIGQMEGVPEKIVGAIDSLENLVRLLHEITNDQQLRVLLDIIANALEKNIIQRSEDLSATLISLTPEKIALVLTALKNHLLKIVATAENFLNILRNLSVDQRTEVYLSLKEDLGAFITCIKDFYHITAFLNDEQRSEFYERHKQLIINKIKNSNDFCFALPTLSPAQRSEIYRHFQKDLLVFIGKNPEKFCEVVANLSPEECDAVCERLKKTSALQAIIKDERFGEMFMSFTDSEKQKVTLALQKTLCGAFVDYPSDFDHATHTARKVFFELSPKNVEMLGSTTLDMLITMVKAEAKTKNTSSKIGNFFKSTKKKYALREFTKIGITPTDLDHPDIVCIKIFAAAPPSSLKSAAPRPLSSGGRE